MKASILVNKLNELINKHGDYEVSLANTTRFINDIIYSETKTHKEFIIDN